MTLLAGIIFAGYRSSNQKGKAARANMLLVEQDLNVSKKEGNTVAQKPVNDEEWLTFKNESELKIRDHEVRINELKIKVKTQEELFDAPARKKIANLEQQNKYAKSRLENFEKSPSNWDSFKYGFNNEMDAIENALKDLSFVTRN